VLDTAYGPLVNVCHLQRDSFYYCYCNSDDLCFDTKSGLFESWRFSPDEHKNQSGNILPDKDRNPSGSGYKMRKAYAFQAALAFAILFHVPMAAATTYYVSGNFDYKPNFGSLYDDRAEASFYRPKHHQSGQL
jgi:hypothetical protein